jgi:multimeric flavodoxin WrbA
MVELYEKLESADILIIGSPIYWYGPTAVTKLFIDRLRPYYGNKRLAGKKAAVLLPAAEGAADCDLTIEMFKRIFNALGIEFLGEVTAKAFDIGEVLDDVAALRSIHELANKIEESA